MTTPLRRSGEKFHVRDRAPRLRPGIFPHAYARTSEDQLRLGLDDIGIRRARSSGGSEAEH